MNLAVVLRASWAVAKVLAGRGLAGSTVIVGRDARHGSAQFAVATAEVLAAEGFSVTLLPDPAPTPVLAFAVRHTGAAAGIQITASHNPPADNGYKVYLDGGIQIVSPTDREIEAAIATAPFADEIARETVEPADAGLVEQYIERAARLRRSSSGPIRVALTPLHGVGGVVATETLHRAGLSDVHTVAGQFAPDPDFPTVSFPNPEEPGATDALLAWPPMWTPTSPSRLILTRTGVRSAYRHRSAGGCCPATKPVGCSAITYCRTSTRAIAPPA